MTGNPARHSHDQYLQPGASQPGRPRADPSPRLLSRSHPLGLQSNPLRGVHPLSIHSGESILFESSVPSYEWRPSLRRVHPVPYLRLEPTHPSVEHILSPTPQSSLCFGSCPLLPRL